MKIRVSVVRFDVQGCTSVARAAGQPRATRLATIDSTPRRAFRRPVLPVATILLRLLGSAAPKTSSAICCAASLSPLLTHLRLSSIGTAGGQRSVYNATLFMFCHRRKLLRKPGI